MTLTGTLSVSAGGTVVTGSGTNFTTSLFPGDYIRPGGQGQVRMVIAIHSSTLLSVDRPFFNTVTGPANSSVRLNRFPFIEDGL